jgi:hypothetical protein
MTNWMAQTRQNKISITSYKYDDSFITGFIGAHQPAIWMGDYGYITEIGKPLVRPVRLEQVRPFQEYDPPQVA